MDQHCPQTGKIYVLIIVCLVFSAILTSINVMSKTNLQTSDELFGTGVAINVIQTIFTMYLVGIDLFGSCRGFSKTQNSGCGDGCKWYSFAPNIYKCGKSAGIKGYVYVPIILLSSAYMLSFGLINILGSDASDVQEIAMASFITGAVGILYILSDITCFVGC